MPPPATHANYMHTEGMKAIQVRNVPDDVHSALQRRADTAGQSMQEYLLELLRQHTARPTIAEWLEEAGSDSGGSGTFEQIVRGQRAERDQA